MLLDPFCTARGFPMFRPHLKTLRGSTRRVPAGGMMRIKKSWFEIRDEHGKNNVSLIDYKI